MAASGSDDSFLLQQKTPLREIPQGDTGRVRVDGLDWQARTVDGTPLPKDACCEVKNVDGAVLIVSAVPVPAAAQPAEQLH